jgi:hypothetical protein
LRPPSFGEHGLYLAEFARDPQSAASR